MYEAGAGREDHGERDRGGMRYYKADILSELPG